MADDKMSAEELERALECECGDMVEQQYDGSWYVRSAEIGKRCSPCQLRAHIEALTARAEKAEGEAAKLRGDVTQSIRAQDDPLYRLSTLIETETWQASHLEMREIVQAGMQEIARLRNKHASAHLLANQRGHEALDAAVDREKMRAAYAALKREADRMRGALVIAAERLRVAASRVERADTEFGIRQWADEADAAALSHQADDAGAVSETERLSALLERDRATVASGLSKARNVILEYGHLIEGRGSYAWNDDRWHAEFKRASKAFMRALKPLEAVAGDRSDCPTTDAGVAAARAIPFDDAGAVTGSAERLREAMQKACDLLAERTYGSHARSPGHNARLVLEAALSPVQQGGK